MNWKFFIAGLCEIMDGFVKVISLGRITSQLYLRWIYIVTKKEFNKIRKEQKNG